jgi:tRNA-intron endonuclease, archaea type
MDSELLGNLIIVKDEKGTKLHHKSHYGKLIEEGLQLSLIEALFLMEKEKITVSKDGVKLSLDRMLEMVQKEGLFIKYIVFKDLRNRGYIIKTGFKYGSEFRLYERGKSPGDGHSDYLVKVASEDEEIPLSNLSSYVRVAHGVNKYLLFAVVDSENDITYYNVEWTRP